MGSFDVQAMLALGRVSTVALSPDGSALVAQVARLDAEKKKLVSQLHRVELATGATSSLTSDPRGATAPAFRRDGALGFLRKGEGDVDQVFVLPAGGGEAAAITDEPLGVSAFAFAKNADVLVLETPVLPGVAREAQRAVEKARKDAGPSMLRFGAMPVRFWDAWFEPAATHLVAIDATGRRDLTPAADLEHRPRALEPARWTLSPDGTFLVAVARVGVNADRTDRWEVRHIDVATGETRAIRAAPNTEYGAPVIAPDGKRLAIPEQTLSKDGLGPRRIALVDLASREAAMLAEDWDAWPDPVEFTPDGRDLIVVVDERGEKHVYALHLATSTRTRVTSGGGSHDATHVTPDGRHVVGLRHTFRAPQDPFACDLAADAEPELVARLSGLEAPLDHIDVESFDVASRDGTIVQSFLVRPKGVARPKVVFWIHGGPISQFADAWHWRWCSPVLASAGYAVVLPNPRGSTGRGQAFVDGIWNNRWGAECYEDLMAVADHVATRPDLDGAHMAAMGGSFGGYMSNLIGGTTDRFRAIVTHASIFHFEAFAWTTDVPAVFYAELGGIEPAKARDRYDLHSPHRRVDQWKTPTLILHGEKDYRCPISDALMLFEALQARGVPSELAVFPDENHFIQKPRNIAAWYETVIAFLGKHL
jgi:dipeptidyl aminopeptidase/acylaminoacyl peptidase